MELIAAIVLAVIIATIVGLLLMKVVGPLILMLPGPVGQIIGNFFVQYGWILGALVGLWWFFAGPALFGVSGRKNI